VGAGWGLFWVVWGAVDVGVKFGWFELYRIGYTECGTTVVWRWRGRCGALIEKAEKTKVASISRPVLNRFIFKVE
jgi:hypothetical protein